MKLEPSAYEGPGPEMEYWGTLRSAMKYLFMAISNGVDWLALYESLDMLGNWYLLGYLAYILFMVFAVINIVSGMFIERAFKVVKQDRDFWIFEEKSMKYEYEDRV